MKIVPFVDFYKKQDDYYNKAVHDILMKKITLMLPFFPKNRKEERYHYLVSNWFYQIGVWRYI